MDIVERVQKLLLTPKSEWEAIEAEPATLHGIFTNYVMILAAIPAVSNFIGYSVIGIAEVRVPMSYGVTQMVLTYVLTLAFVYLLAILICSLAGPFGGQKNFLMALKVAAFAPTAAWLAGVFKIVPWLAILSLVGGLYSLYLLYVGLPMLMKTPESQSIAYIAVVALIIIVLTVIIATMQFLTIPPLMRGF
jgi:hypothetical protein